jgi:serine/threonine-protein kinase RsbW
MDAMNSVARTINLSIDSRLENVPLVGLAVRGIVSQSSLGEVDAYHVEVSIVEAVNNAIQHAYQGNPGQDVEIVLSLHADRIECTVSDAGVPLESFRGDGPDYDPTDRANLPEGGMGLAIIRRGMDEAAYESRGGKNTLRMVKRIGC